MALTFYYAPMSTATVTHVELEELGIPYEKVKLDIKAGDQNKPEFRKLNPHGKVPTIVDDGVPVFESLAIAIHLGEKYGVERGLWPAAGSKERPQALSWVVWTHATLAVIGFMIMSNESSESPENMKSAARAEFARGEFEKLLATLDAHLAGREVMVGNQYSLVDAHLGATLGWLKAAIPYDLAKWKNISAWLAKASARPAVGRVWSGAAG